MFDRINSLSAAAFSLAIVASSAAMAGSTGRAVTVPAVIGAMYESRALARSAADVSRQGGFATAGTVRWLARAPDTQAVAAF